jgi:thioredoxin
MKNIAVILTLFVTLVACQNFNGQAQNPGRNSPTSVDAKTFAELIKTKTDGQLVDVRTPGEFQGGYIAGAMNLDFNGSDYGRQVAALDKNKPVLVYCLSGGRSASAAKGMRNAGFKEVIELQGGIMAWNKNNLPITGATNSNNPGMTESEFNSLLQSAPVVMVDFYAPWCAPCKKMKPILDEIEKEYNGKVTVVRINQDEHKALCKSMNITTLPTIAVYKGGKQSFKHEGVIEKTELVKQF